MLSSLLRSYPSSACRHSYLSDCTASFFNNNHNSNTNDGITTAANVKDGTSSLTQSTKLTAAAVAREFVQACVRAHVRACVCVCVPPPSHSQQSSQQRQLHVSLCKRVCVCVFVRMCVCMCTSSLTQSTKLTAAAIAREFVCVFVRVCVCMCVCVYLLPHTVNKAHSSSSCT